MTSRSIACGRCGERLAADAAFCGACGARLSDPHVDRVVGDRYVLRERTGTGVLGILYRAEQLGVGRSVAVKLLPREAEHDRALVERFQREGELLCRLTSPHTVTAYDYGLEPDGTRYIAMEWSSGRSLAELLRDQSPLDEARVLRIMMGVCNSLAEAHGLGVVHRGLQPDSILVELRPSNPDFVKVLDFGSARLVADDGAVSVRKGKIGDVAYRAPEQLLERPIIAATDIYALGVIGFQLVTGRHPFEGARGVAQMVAAHLERIPERASSLRPELSRELDALLARCLDKDPERRPDARTLANVIDGVMSAPPDHDTFRQ
jgi:serine/threonine protein kinase